MRHLKLTDILNELQANYTRTDGEEASKVKRDVDKFLSKVSRMNNIPKNTKANVKILYGGECFKAGRVRFNKKA